MGESTENESIYSNPLSVKWKRRTAFLDILSNYKDCSSLDSKLISNDQEY